MDYANGKVYKIVNDIDDEIYVGSTRDSLCKRMSSHRSMAKNPLGKYSQGKIYQKMRGCGIEHFRIVLVEEYPCKNKDQLRAREEYWRKELQATLNSVSAYTSKEEAKKRNNDYYHEHHDYFLQKKREYNKKNKEEINKKNREYHKVNKEKIAKHQQEHHFCECGYTYAQNHKQRHLRSKQHAWYMEMNQNPDQTEYLICDCGMYYKAEKKRDTIRHENSKMHKLRMKMLYDE